MDYFSLWNFVYKLNAGTDALYNLNTEPEGDAIAMDDFFKAIEENS